MVSNINSRLEHHRMADPKQPREKRETETERETTREHEEHTTHTEDDVENEVREGVPVDE